MRSTEIVWHNGHGAEENMLRKKNSHKNQLAIKRKKASNAAYYLLAYLSIFLLFTSWLSAPTTPGYSITRSTENASPTLSPSNSNGDLLGQEILW